ELEFGKATNVTLECDDLTIHREAFPLLFPEGRDQLRVPVIQSILIPRPQLHIGPAPQCQAPFPVELGLKEPSLARKAFFRKRCQHGWHPSGACVSAQPCPRSEEN